MIIVKAAPAGRGSAWLTEAFGYFGRDALTWIGVTIVLFLIAIAVNVIPMGGVALQIATPVFSAGLMIGCREQDQGRSLQLSHLFTAFSDNDRIGQLVMIGVLYLVGIIVITILVMILGFMLFGGMAFIHELAAERAPQELAVIRNLLLLMLIGTALYLPLLMAIWFAPVLVILERVDAIHAMQLSFNACVVNFVPLLVYGIVGLVFTILATIPFMLGWLVLFPMIVVSIYLAYKDVFEPVQQDEAPAPA